MKKILITGINGFAGSHLSDYIIKNKFGEIYGTYQSKTSNFSNIKHIVDTLSLIKCDINTPSEISAAIKQADPDYVFHLAAKSFVPDSWKSPHETLQSNILGSLNVFEAIRNLSPETTVHVASSSEVYGMVYQDELPVKETNPLRPFSPYGVSKAAMDLLGYQYHQSYALKIIRTRAFNHTGPRRGEVFVASDWAKQIVSIEKGLHSPELYVGSLTSERDFTDVRDVVRGYWLAATKGDPGEVYNICSGKTHRMQEILDLLLSFTDKKISVKKDPSRMRPSDVKTLYGDSTKFREKTGWKPKTSLKKTMGDLIDYWRGKILS